MKNLQSLSDIPISPLKFTRKSLEMAKDPNSSPNTRGRLSTNQTFSVTEKNKSETKVMSRLDERRTRSLSNQERDLGLRKRSRNKKEKPDECINQTINNRFLIQRKLGAGSFGVVYRGYDKQQKIHVSIKLEVSNKFKSQKSQLANEMLVYDTIYKFHINLKENKVPVNDFKDVYEEQAKSPTKDFSCLSAQKYCFPKVFYFEKFKNWLVLVTELLGPNLEDVFVFCKKSFSVKTIFMLALDILDCLELIHASGMIHRDIKPANFLLARTRKLTGNKLDSGKYNMISHHQATNQPNIYCIDLGMAVPWREQVKGEGKGWKHVAHVQTGSMCGTARYTSLNNHEGYSQSRRDDLEAVANCLVYFARGKLPWMGLKKQPNVSRHIIIGRKKKEMAVAQICEGLDEEYQVFYNYVRCLRFEEDPDYSFMKRIFKKGLMTRNFLKDGLYDWVKFDVEKYVRIGDLLNSEKGQKKSMFGLPTHIEPKSKRKKTTNIVKKPNFYSLDDMNHFYEMEEYTDESKFVLGKNFPIEESFDMGTGRKRNSLFDLAVKNKEIKDLKLCSEVDEELKESFSDQAVLVSGSLHSSKLNIEELDVNVQKAKKLVKNKKKKGCLRPCTIF